MDDSRFQLARGDAVAWLRTLPAASVDLVITDPAYESLEKHRAIGTTTRLKHSKSSSNDWFIIFPNVRFAELFVEAFRVLNPTPTCICTVMRRRCSSQNPRPSEPDFVSGSRSSG